MSAPKRAGDRLPLLDAVAAAIMAAIVTIPRLVQRMERRVGRWMRKRVYRSVRVLDPFSDAHCEAMLLRIERHRSAGRVLVTFLAGVLAFALFFALYIGTFAALRFIASERWWRTDYLVTGLGRLAFVVQLLASGLIALGAYSALMIQWRRRKLARLVDGAVCFRCSYCLIGLPARDGVIRCPECGSTVPVSDPRMAPFASLTRVGTAQPPAERAS